MPSLRESSDPVRNVKHTRALDLPSGSIPFRLGAMPTSARAAGDPVAEFAARLEASLAQGTFVRLTLSNPKPLGGQPQKILGRCIDLKRERRLSLTLRWPTRDEVRNFMPAEGVQWVLERIRSSFPSALLCTTVQDWQLTIAPKQGARLIRHPPSQATVPSRVHDQPTHSLLDLSAADWTAPLGLTDAQGKVRSGMAHKHSQVARYLEIFSHLARDCGWADAARSGQVPEWVIADMGCGKAYLTFGLWHFCRRLQKWPVRIIGIESRQELVGAANQLAQQISACGLEFVAGDIETASLAALRALIALHACNTATDAAILRGIDLGAQLIVVAPCCHKQLRPQLGRPAPFAPLLQHGLLEERLAEWTTDGLRALFLEWAGYRTKVIEFIASDHTPKNLMIAAIREKPAYSNEQMRQNITALKSFFDIKTHALDPLLSLAPKQQ
jgi:hypothetical protein